MQPIPDRKLTRLSPSRSHQRPSFVRPKHGTSIAKKPEAVDTDGSSKGDAGVATGTVKYFNMIGYGLIQPDGGGDDFLFHISALEKVGYTGLAEGAKVSFEAVPNGGKELAENLKIR